MQTKVEMFINYAKKGIFAMVLHWACVCSLVVVNAMVDVLVTEFLKYIEDQDANVKAAYPNKDVLEFVKFQVIATVGMFFGGLLAWI